MSKIILNSDLVIVAKGNDVYQVENGIFVDGVIYAEHGLTFTETDQPFEIQKNKFINGQVVPNENYVQPPKSTDELLHQLKTAADVFAETNPAAVELSTYKDLKIESLKEACTADIYAGFKSESTGHSFGFNANDQMNFTQVSLRILAANGSYNKPIQWKALSGSIVPLTVAQFNALLDEAEDHKVEKQTKFWTLEALVKAASDAVAVKALVW